MEIAPYEESQDVIQRKLDQTTMILQNINAYFLLIDKDFIVCDTNYYSLNKLPAPEVGMTQKVGDLLHCRNAAEADPPVVGSQFHDPERAGRSREHLRATR